MKDGTEYGIGAESKALDWKLLDWQLIEKSIRKLRQHIFRATREQKLSVVRSESLKSTESMIRDSNSTVLAFRYSTANVINKMELGEIFMVSSF